MRNIIICMLLCGCITTVAQEKKSNRDIFYSLSKKIVTQTVSSASIQPHTKIYCGIASSSFNKFSRYSIVNALHDEMLDVFFIDSLATINALFNVAELSVKYSKDFSEHFYSERKTERTVSVIIQTEIVERESQRLLWSDTAHETFVDTIDVSSIDELEKSSKDIVTTQYEQHSFFDKILEPLVVTVASAVAIYLFFTIRS